MKKQMKKELLIAVQNAKQEGVSVREILEIVLEGIDTIQTAAAEPKPEPKPEIATAAQEEPLEQKVSCLLHEIGVPAHIKGYHYIRSAVLYTMENPIALDMITKLLYPKVAKIYQTTPSRVERAIRHAIEVAWDRGNLEAVHEIFGYTVNSSKGRPTNSEFLAMIVDYLKFRRK